MGDRVEAVTRRWRRGCLALGTVLAFMSLLCVPSAHAGAIGNFDGTFGNDPFGIGPGTASPETARLPENVVFAGRDDDGAKLAALDLGGSPGTVFPGPDAVTLAPASTQPSVPVVGATNVASTHYARGSRDLVAAAWADQTAGVLHVRVLDGGPTTEPEAPIAPQSIDVAVGGNAAPVATAIRFTADGSALLVAAQAVTVDGGVTTRAWAVARVRLGVIDPAVPGSATLDPAYGSAGLARGPFTSAGGGVQAMELRGAGGAVLTGTGAFTGADAAPTALHVLALDAGGQPDPTFGTAGLATIDATADPDVPPFGPPALAQTATDVVVGATGDITVGGGEGATGAAFVVRLTPAGNPRQSFGAGGRVVTDGLPAYEEIAVLPDGTFYALAPNTELSSLERFTASGEFVSGAGFGGADLRGCAIEARAMELLLIDDGNDLIVIAGQCGPQGQTAFAFSDFLGLRRVRATVLPEAIEGGGRSVALDEAARTDPQSAAQDELGGTIAATPLRGSPLRGSPLRGSPLRGSPLRGSPLRGSPLRGSPLTEVPLRGSGGWTAALEDTPLRGSPLQSITLGDVLDLDPIPDVALGDLDPTRGALRRTSVASLLLLGRPLDVLPLPSSAGWCAYLQGLGPTPRCGAPIDLTLHGLLDVELFGGSLREYFRGRPIPLTVDVLGTGDDPPRSGTSRWATSTSPPRRWAGSVAATSATSRTARPARRRSPSSRTPTRARSTATRWAACSRCCASSTAPSSRSRSCCRASSPPPSCRPRRRWRSTTSSIARRRTATASRSASRSSSTVT